MVKKVILPVILAVIVLLTGCLNEQGDIIPSPSVYVIGTSDNITSGTATDLTGLLYGDGSTIDATAKPTGTVVGTTDEQTLTNKTFTTPVLAQLYQDASKTKLITIPATTDTLVGKATTDELTNKTLNASVAKGTWTASGTWTIPMVTLGGALSANGQAINGLDYLSGNGISTALAFYGGGAATAYGAQLYLYGKSHASTGGVALFTPNADDSADAVRLTVSGHAPTAVATWSNVTQVGLVLGSNMTINNKSFVGDVYITGDCSALTFTDRTKWYEGDALSALSNIKGEFGLVDHNSLPLFAKKSVAYTDSNNITQYRDERDLGAMITLLTKSTQQLDTRTKNTDAIVQILLDEIIRLSNEIEKLKSK